MGEAKRRKQLGLTDRELVPNTRLSKERELYKEYKLTKLKPDLGMELFPEYLHAFKIGCSNNIQVHPDSIFGTGVVGILSSYDRIGNNQMPRLPLFTSEGYCFTIALGKGKTRQEIDLNINLLKKCELIVTVAPKYKYLTQGTNEWVIPLIPTNLVEDKIEPISG
jgi:hypothetical protein